jgi:FAD/FMN-containing dehydrogenase
MTICHPAGIAIAGPASGSCEIGGCRNVGMVNLERLARALSVDLPTFMARAEAKRSR